jgi:hypothetical protein
MLGLGSGIGLLPKPTAADRASDLSRHPTAISNCRRLGSEAAANESAICLSLIVQGDSFDRAG